MCKRADERSSYLLRYVTNQYETEQMSNNTILEHAGTLKFLPDCCKNEEMCDKAVDDYRYALEFVPRYYKPQKICDKAVDTQSSSYVFVLFDSISGQYETPEIWFVMSFFNIVVYCPYK